VDETHHGVSVGVSEGLVRRRVPRGARGGQGGEERPRRQRQGPPRRAPALHRQTTQTERGDNHEP
jgi:hypothetical protein